jgi:hypothetical protein
LTKKTADIMDNEDTFTQTEKISIQPKDAHNYWENMKNEDIHNHRQREYIYTSSLDD